MSLHNYNIYISDLKPEVVGDICKDAGIDPKPLLEGKEDMIVGEIDFDWLYEVFGEEE